MLEQLLVECYKCHVREFIDKRGGLTSRMIRAVEERGVNTVRLQVLMIGEATSGNHRPGRSLLWYSTELTGCLGADKSSRGLIPVLVKYTHPRCSV